MSGRIWLILWRLIGLGLIALVLSWVGWRDRVTGVDGREHTGRVVEQTEDSVELADGTVVAIEGPTAVRRGLAGAYRDLAGRPGLAIIGFLLLLGSAVLMQVRWAVYVFGADLPATWPQVFRLGWIGLFFSQLIPAGQVGGDLAKAYGIAKANPGRRVQAVVSVLADRGIGLFVLCLAAMVGVLFAPKGSTIETARGIVVGFFAFSILFLFLISSRRARAALGLKRILGRFKGLFAVGDAFRFYGERWGVIGASIAVGLGVHALFLGFFFCIGRAMGIELSAFALLVAIPVAQMAGNLPGLPAGWGVGDLAFYFFLPAAGVPPGLAVALSFSFRICFMLLSLPGALLLKELPRTPVRGTE